MRKSKKAMAMLLAAAMAAVSLGGCKGEETAEAAENRADEDVNSISVMGVDWGYGPKQGSEMEQYWEETFGVELEIDWVSYQDYAEKLNTLMASGKSEDIPDVVQIMSSNNGGFYYPVFAQAVNAGMFVNLDKYLFDEGMAEDNEVMREWSDQLWENTKYQGHTYILPRSITEVAPNSGVCVRRDLMREYGFEEEPETMEELKDWLIGLSEASGLYGLEFSTPDFNDAGVAAFATAFTGQGLWGIDGDGDYIYQPFADGYTDFMDWMKELYDAGAIDPEFILNQTEVSEWRGGKSVADLNAWYNWNQSEDRVTNKIFDENLPDTCETWCLLPVKGPKGYAVSLDSFGFGEAIAINARCSEEKVRRILEVFNQTGDEYMDVMMNGVEGVHYDLANGERTISDEQKTARQEGYVGGWNQIFLKANLDTVEQKFIDKGCSQESIDRAYELKEVTEKAVEEMGLTSPTNNLISETYNNSWSTLIADCNDMIAQYIMGQIDLDTWNSYAQGILESADYQAINEEFKAAAEEKEAA